MNKLTEQERYIIEDKGTEAPFSGEYNNTTADGVYFCKRCHTPLFLAKHKFQSHCGWPAFDDQLDGAIKQVSDADGRRTEIVCQNCDAHLGHVFTNEGLTAKNLRHCVNSLSLTFEPEEANVEQHSYQFATLGAGCFWCIEAIFSQLEGVLSVQSGYCGGDALNADYKSVCQGDTGHAEVVNIKFDPSVISYQQILAVFWEIHDPTTLNRQGNDVGSQYRSVIFVHNDQQISVASEMLAQLQRSHIWPNPVVTEISAFTDFYPAENYHNDYFAQHGEEPYCQLVVKPKVEKFEKAFADFLKQ